jgi:8-hydroxy-5-deazaflavin:NADPH oxidoreductase
MNIGIIGGTGPLGRGLALRWTQVGHTVYLGSRTLPKAKQVVDEMGSVLSDGSYMKGELLPASNEEAVTNCELAVLAVPAAADEEFIRQLKPALQGKILIDCTVALDPNDVTHVPPAHVATAVNLQSLLGRHIRVVAGFHTIAASKLAKLEQTLSDDTFFAGDDPEAKAAAMGLATEIGLRAFDIGSLEDAGTLKRITAMLIGLNKRYKRRAIGVKLTGI